MYFNIEFNKSYYTSTCGGLVAFGYMEGPSGPLDNCKKKLDPHFL